MNAHYHKEISPFNLFRQLSLEWRPTGKRGGGSHGRVRAAPAGLARLAGAGRGGHNSAVPSGSRKRPWIATAARVAGSAAILALLFYFVPFAEAWQALRRLPPLYWFLVLLAYLFLHLVGVSKYELMLNGADAGLNFPQATRCYFAGLFSTLFLPTVVGGDLVKAGLALRLARNRAGVLVGSLLDRLLDAGALVALATLGAAVAPTLEPADRRGFLIVLIVVVGSVGAGAAVVMFLPGRFFCYRNRRRLVRLRRAGRSVARHPGRVVGALGLAFFVQLGFLSLTTLIGAACGLHLPYRAWLFAWPLAKISAFVPLGQAGIGVREAALAAFLAPFGAAAGVVVGVGLAWDTIIIAAGLIAGVVSLAVGRLPAAKSRPIEVAIPQRYGVGPSGKPPASKASLTGL